MHTEGIQGNYSIPQEILDIIPTRYIQESLDIEQDKQLHDATAEERKYHAITKEFFKSRPHWDEDEAERYALLFFKKEDRAELSKTEIYIMVYLLFCMGCSARAGGGLNCRPKQATLANFCGMKRSSIQRAIISLRNKGKINYYQKKRKLPGEESWECFPNTYWFTQDSWNLFYLRVLQDTWKYEKPYQVKIRLTREQKAKKTIREALEKRRDALWDTKRDEMTTANLTALREAREDSHGDQKKFEGLYRQYKIVAQDMLLKGVDVSSCASFREHI